MPSPLVHVWITPAMIAAQLDATRHGDHWRASCPAHGGENTSALAITEGTDADGHPMTLLHCFAHECDIAAICVGLGIQVAQLFCIQPAYAKTHRRSPRAHGIGIKQLRELQEATPDDIAQVMLLEMLRDDAGFLEECEPARQTMYRLLQSPRHRLRLFDGLTHLHLNPTILSARLRKEYGG